MRRAGLSVIISPPRRSATRGTKTGRRRVLSAVSAWPVNESASCPDRNLRWSRNYVGNAVRGNHDHAVAQNVVTSGRTGFRYLASVTRVLTRQRLGTEDLRFLADLPVTQVLTLDETRFLLVHATPRDPLDEYAHPDPDLWSRRLHHVDVDVVCVGHTHQPYVLEVGDKLVINPGSVGQPRDGDPRASYVVIDNNRVEIKRVAYPVEDTIRTVQESTLPDQAKEMLREVFRTGRSPHSTEDNNQRR